MFVTCLARDKDLRGAFGVGFEAGGVRELCGKCLESGWQVWRGSGYL